MSLTKSRVLYFTKVKQVIQLLEALLENWTSGQLYVDFLYLKLYHYLTNRFHFAVRLYSDINAQMTSKRGENKEVRYEPQASSVTDVLTTF